jgi:hypothetical protein
VVGNGDHLDSTVRLAIDDVVRKSLENVASSASLETRPDAWSGFDESDRSVRLTDKGLRRLPTPFEVPFEGVLQLPAGLRKIANPPGAHSASPTAGCGDPPKE